MSKIILITGASSGIGKALAEKYARLGWNLVLVAKNPSVLEPFVSDLRKKTATFILPIIQDLRQADAARSIFQHVAAQGLELDILVNNAGFGDHGPFENADLQKQVDMIAVNNTALMSLTHYFLPSLLKQVRPTYIVNLCSTAAFLPGPYMSIYHASKAFVFSFSLALAEELKDTNVVVKTICPGPVATGFQARAGESSAALFDRMKNQTPEAMADFIVSEIPKKKLVSVGH